MEKEYIAFIYETIEKDGKYFINNKKINFKTPKERNDFIDRKIDLIYNNTEIKAHELYNNKDCVYISAEK